MNILAINPWIYDFAAFDFWLKPYGFLVLLEYLKAQGLNIDYIDCLDKKATIADFGRGKYPSQRIEKPDVFSKLPRYYKRYGISIEEFNEKIDKLSPALILITSSMTYWYPAIVELTKLLKNKFPFIPIILGGTYATLCQTHAQNNSGCDRVFTNDQMDDFFKTLKIKPDYTKLYSTLPNYYSYYQKLDYVVFRTSWGCPFNCSYCAIKKLFSSFFRLDCERIIEFITAYAKKGIKDFVLYDDAFLYNQDYALKFLENIVNLKLNIRFHTPNALHLRYLNQTIANLLKKSGFVNPHFGLETFDSELLKQWGDKVNTSDLTKAVGFLNVAGFKNGEFSVYLLLGYPGQNLDQLKEDTKQLHSLGIKISFAEFSPVPGTKMFEQYENIFEEPLLQNNSVFSAFSYQDLRGFWEIKSFLRELNKNWKNPVPDGNL